MTTPSFVWFGKSPSGADVEIHCDLDPDAVSRSAAAADAALKAAGFRPSERFDKPYGGGRPGNARPETPPPSGIIVPQHCGSPMVYKEAYKNKSDKDVGARFTCRKDKQCEDVTSGKSQWPAVDWHLTVDTSQPVIPAAKDRPPVAQRLQPGPNTEPSGDRPMTTEEWTQFWPQIRSMGYDRAQVFAVAGKLFHDDGHAMTDVEFTSMGGKSKVSVHKVFAKLKEHADGVAKEGA